MTQRVTQNKIEIAVCMCRFSVKIHLNFCVASACNQWSCLNWSCFETTTGWGVVQTTSNHQQPFPTPNNQIRGITIDGNETHVINNGPIEKGGLKMPDVESMISAQRILCIKRFLAPDVAAGWKLFLRFLPKRSRGKFLFHCNVDHKKLSITLPEFCKECILAWTSLNENNPTSLSEIANQILWNNRFISIASK